MADGTSEIEEIGHIERGYENIVEKLRGLGADISKVERMPAALESGPVTQTTKQTACRKFCGGLFS